MFARARARPFVLSLLVLSCSAPGREPGSDGPPVPIEAAAPTKPEVDAGVDAAPVDEEVVLEGCSLKRVADPDLCAEDCGARLKLPAKNGSYCTIPCASDADCGALVCPETIGACMPRCTSDAACSAAGFARCDAITGACDTI